MLTSLADYKSTTTREESSPGETTHTTHTHTHTLRTFPMITQQCSGVFTCTCTYSMYDVRQLQLL